METNQSNCCEKCKPNPAGLNDCVYYSCKCHTQHSQESGDNKTFVFRLPDDFGSIWRAKFTDQNGKTLEGDVASIPTIKEWLAPTIE